MYYLKRRNGGFTLIELLIVMAIVAVLAAFTIPVLQMGSRTAKAVKCISNLKGIYLAMAQYTAANDDFLPAAGGPQSGSGGWPSWYRALLPYVGQWEIYECPTKFLHVEDIERDISEGAVEPPAGVKKMAMVHYGMNHAFAEDDKKRRIELWGRTVQRQMVKYPSRTIAFCDTGQIEGGVGGSDDPLEWVETEASAELGYCTFPTGLWRPVARHDGRTNVVYFGGGAEGIPTIDIIAHVYGKVGCLYDNQ